MSASSGRGGGGFVSGAQTALNVIGLIPGAGEFANAANVGLSLYEGDYVGAGASAFAMIPLVGVLGDFARLGKAAGAIEKTAPAYEDLLKTAQEAYPGKAGITELHHIEPIYLGGAKSGATVPIDAAYHQQITNAFRNIRGYGKGPVSAADRQEIMQQVYQQYPLPKQ